MTDAEPDPDEPDEGASTPDPSDDSPLTEAAPTVALADHRLTRAGVFAWSVIGLLILLLALLKFVDIFSLVVVPLVIALLPAALLSPLSEWGKARGVPPALVAAVLVLTFLFGLIALLVAIGWLIANELTDLTATLEDAYADITDWLETRFEVTIPEVDELLESVEEWAMGLDVSGSAQQVASMTIEALSGILLALIALFFYLKDGHRLAQFALDITPARLRGDMSEVGRRVWATLGGYFRGQIVVAAADAVFIGIGLVLLDVPLAMPLAILVFIGGLFPIVGAFTAGGVAVLIALADGGVGLALAVLVLNVAVQQAEGNLLEPLIVGRATKLHPLAVLAALTAGAVTLGILGAFLAVPVLASVVRVVGYVFERDSERAIQPGETSP
ncbi:MAG: AI-2E family transporter [Acidimicrobiales bacterium]|nr:AI-2E family transporter [Acidimicrobiales bacterium]